MKKLNKKGFTLIELIAVIVLLGIITVITIPTVLNSIKNSKEKAFKISANTVAKVFEKKYTSCEMDELSNSDPFNGICSASFDTEFQFYPMNNGSDISRGRKLLEMCGVNPDNYSNGYISIVNDEICITLVANDTGDFKDYAGQIVKSSGCVS